MKNTLPIGFSIVVIFYMLFLMAQAYSLNDNEGVAYGVVSLVIVIFFMFFLCMLSYGILNIFSINIDWTVRENIKSTVLDLFMVFIVNGLFNLILVRSFFSHPELGLALASLLMTTLLCWRIITLFLTR